MIFNMTQVSAAWLVAALIAVILALGQKAPEITAGSAGARDTGVVEAARIGDGSAQAVAGQLVELLMDPAEKRAAAQANGALPFDAIEGAGAGPQISAILIERGVPVVFIRTETGLLTVAEGDAWNEWVVERIESDRVFFSRSGEQFDYLAFASVGVSAAGKSPPDAAAASAAKKEREAKREKRKGEKRKREKGE